MARGGGKIMRKFGELRKDTPTFEVIKCHFDKSRT